MKLILSIPMSTKQLFNVELPATECDIHYGDCRNKGFPLLTLFFFFYRDDNNSDNNLRVGLFVVVSFFLVISVLAFPNGKISNSSLAP